MGASETFGLYESPDMEFPAQMQQIFDRNFPGGFQVLNAACPGMSPSRITHYYRVWIRQFDPDYVVYYPTPSFMLDADTVTILRTPSEQRRPHFQPSFRIEQRVSNALKQFLPTTIQTYVRELMMKRELQRHSSDWVVDTIPESAVQLFAQNLVVLANTVKQSGAKIIFATHANRISDPMTKEDLPALIAWRKQNPRRTEHCIIEMEKTANIIIRQVSVEQGIPVVDLAMIVPKSDDYFADYLHFTDQGAEVVADALVKQVFQLTR
jgi:lysophospholipase L1-like esterase